MVYRVPPLLCAFNQKDHIIHLIKQRIGRREERMMETHTLNKKKTWALLRKSSAVFRLLPFLPPSYPSPPSLSLSLSLLIVYDIQSSQISCSRSKGVSYIFDVGWDEKRKQHTCVLNECCRTTFSLINSAAPSKRQMLRCVSTLGQ